MPLPFAAIALGAGALKGITSAIQGFQAGREAKKINPIWKQYETSQYAKEGLGDAQSRLNARDFGAQALYNNIQTGAQNAMANVQRNAMTPASALAAVAGVNAQTNQAMFQQAANEAQNFYRRQSNLNQARGTMIREGDKVHNSIMQKYQMDMDRKTALENKRDQSFVNAFGSIAGTAAAGANLQQSARLNDTLGGILGSLGKRTSTPQSASSILGPMADVFRGSVADSMRVGGTGLSQFGFDPTGFLQAADLGRVVGRRGK